MIGRRLPHPAVQLNRHAKQKVRTKLDTEPKPDTHTALTTQTQPRYHQELTTVTKQERVELQDEKIHEMPTAAFRKRREYMLISDCINNNKEREEFILITNEEFIKALEAHKKTTLAFGGNRKGFANNDYSVVPHIATAIIIPDG